MKGLSLLGVLVALCASIAMGGFSKPEMLSACVACDNGCNGVPHEDTDGGAITFNLPDLQSGDCDEKVPPNPPNCKWEEKCKLNGTLEFTNNTAGKIRWRSVTNGLAIGWSDLDSGHSHAMEFENLPLSCGYTDEESGSRMESSFCLEFEYYISGGAQTVASNARFCFTCSDCAGL